jgi:hypothetical protein
VYIVGIPLAESLEGDRMTVGEHDGFISGRDVRIIWRKRPGTHEILECAPIVAGAPIGTGESTEQVGILSRRRCDLEQDRQRFRGRAFSQQRVGEPDRRIDVRRMLTKDRSKSRLGIGRPPNAQVEPRNPQASFGVGGVLLNDLPEQLNGFGILSCPGELLGASALIGHRLRCGGEDDDRDDAHQHVV